MRFRPKFQWVQIAAAITMVGSSYLWIHRSGADPVYLVTGIIWFCLGISNFASYFFTWWEITAAGLIQRRVWDKRMIPWSEITKIGPWQPGKKPQPAWVEVDYARDAPMSDRGALLLQPAERDGLIRALRAHAPQADFEMFPLEL